MSNTNTNLQTQTSNALHNAIMEAGGKDRPPMLAPGNYVQWKSRIKRYIDTKPNNELIHYCLKKPPYKFKWTEKTVPVSEGIDNDIYSTVDTCPNACEMWKAIERLKQEPTMVAEDDEMSKDKEIDKLMALISLSFKKIYKPTNNNLRTSSNTSRANQDNTPRINRGTGYDNQRVVNVVGARENVGTQVVQQSGIQCYNYKEYGHLNAEQADWRDDTDDEPEDKELEAYYMYMAQIQEVTPDAADNSGPIFDVEPLQKVQNNDDIYNVFSIKSEHPEQPESVNATYPVDQDEHNIIIDSLDMSYNRNCKTSFVQPEFLKKAQRANPRLYDIGFYNDNLALILAPDSDETIRLSQ
ncbi:hypothetical protein Tco_1329610 [Tanacetum coccineum]